MTSASQTIQPLGFTKKLGLAWCVALLVGGAMWGGATLIANRRWKIAEADWKALGLPSTAGALALPVVPDAENAARAFLSAEKLIFTDSPSSSNETYSTQWLPYPANWWRLADASATKNAAAFPAAVAAARLPRSNWGVTPSGGGISALNNARNLANTLRDEAQHRHFLGDDAAAFDLLETTSALAISLQRENLLVSNLVGVGIDALWTSVIPQMAADLRVGSGPGSVPEARVRAMIDSLCREDVEIRDEVRAADLAFYRTTLDAPPQRRFTLGPTLTALTAFQTERVTAAVKAHRGLGPPIDGKPGPFGFGGGPDRVSGTTRRQRLNRSIAAASLMVALYRASHESAWPKTEAELVNWYGGPMPIDPYAEKGLGLVYSRFGADLRPVLRGVGSSGLIPTQPPFARWPTYFPAGPSYEVSYYKPPDEVNVWIDLSLYPSPPPPAATAPSEEP